MKDKNDFTMKEVRHILWVATRKIRRLHAKNKLKQKYLSKLRQELLWLRLLPLTKEAVNKWYVRDGADYYRDFAKIFEEYRNPEEEEDKTDEISYEEGDE